MVALYLQNTKKILIIWLFSQIMLLNNCSAQNNGNCQKIEEYLELGLRLQKDSIRFNEILEGDINFYNKTDEIIFFYPKAPTFLTKEFQTFGVDSSILISDTLDMRKKVRINPNESYTISFKVLVKEPFFALEENKIKLFYNIKELGGRNKKYNTFCGKLESPEVILYMIRELH